MSIAKIIAPTIMMMAQPMIRQGLMGLRSTFFCTGKPPFRYTLYMAEDTPG
jgi:hypothetical protein